MKIVMIVAMIIMKKKIDESLVAAMLTNTLLILKDAIN